MTSKIKELAQQAGLIAGEHDDLDFKKNLTDKEKKFAELIVQECCDKIEREYKYAQGEKTQWAMAQDVQDLLKEHFKI